MTLIFCLLELSQFLSMEITLKKERRYSATFLSIKISWKRVYRNNVKTITFKKVYQNDISFTSINRNYVVESTSKGRRFSNH